MMFAAMYTVSLGGMLKGGGFVYEALNVTCQTKKTRSAMVM